MVSPSSMECLLALLSSPLGRSELVGHISIVISFYTSAKAFILMIFWMFIWKLKSSSALSPFSPCQTPFQSNEKIHNPDSPPGGELSPKLWALVVIGAATTVVVDRLPQYSQKHKGGEINPQNFILWVGLNAIFESPTWSVALVCYFGRSNVVVWWFMRVVGLKSYTYFSCGRDG